jgi:hypothetical protein
MTKFIYHGYTLRREMLLEWRKRYIKEIYSSKVAWNLFYDLFALDTFWGDSEVSGYLMHGVPIFSNFADSYEFIKERYRTIQTQVVAPKLQGYLNQNPTVLGISWLNCLPLVDKANNGSNADVEEIEYSYIYYGTVNLSVQAWLALRFVGCKDDQSFETVTGASCENRQINSLFNLYSEIYKSIAVYFDGSLGNKKIGYYEKLPNLW